MNSTNPDYKEVKKLLIDLDMPMSEFAAELGVTRDAVYKALKGNPWLGKLRARIQEKVAELNLKKAKAAA
jgi:predicted transcriptional regulator